MCTVTYLPTGKNSFILTSNRDEHVLRPLAIPPAEYLINNLSLSFPKDPLGGGTWIALEKNKTVACLLNGAFEPHVRLNEYRRSRGLVLLDFFEFKNGEAFCNNYDFKNIEPFTLIVVLNNDKKELNEIRWDGDTVHFKNIDAHQSAIWSSCTLYDKSVADTRKRWFDEWLENYQDFEIKNIKEFHQNAGKGDTINGLIMKRDNGMRTVSITSIICNSTYSEIHYSDIINNQHFLHRP